MFDKYYQPSKKVSAAGLLILLAVFIVVGGALGWVYLWIIRKCTIVILNVFAAIGYGVLMGFLGRLTVKKCKLRNPMAVLIAVVVGVLAMTYLKWGMYDYYDYQLIAEQYDEYVGSSDFDKDLKDAIKKVRNELIAETSDAYTFFKMYYDFDNYTFDENYDYLQNNAYEAISYEFSAAGADINESYTAESQALMKNYTLYDWLYYDILLGKTKEECKKNVEKAKEMRVYEYLEDLEIDVDEFIALYYYGIEDEGDYSSYTYTTPTMLEILTHPGDLWKDIKDINKEGRWSYTSSSSSSSYSSSTTSSEPVKGGMLWFVWICELLIIDLTSLFIAYSQSKKIFIEMDNDWAELYDNNKFTFSNMSKLQLKSMLEQSPDNIMNLTPVDPVKLIGRPYVKLTVSHSKDYSENYLNGLIMTYNAKNRNYVSSPAFDGLRMTPKQTGVLFSMFGVEPMGAIASDPDYMAWNGNGGAAYGGYSSDVQTSSSPAPSASMDSATTTCGSCGAQMPAGKKFCPNCGAPYEKTETANEQSFDRISFEAWQKAGKSSNTPSDEMDGISTDDIDTTNL